VNEAALVHWPVLDIYLGDISETLLHYFKFGNFKKAIFVSASDKALWPIEAALIH